MPVFQPIRKGPQYLGALSISKSWQQTVPESGGEQCIHFSHGIFMDVQHVPRFLPGLAQ